MYSMIDFETLKYENYLIFVVVQDHISREVLMCAYMTREALEKTIETGIAHFWSRSRQKLWKKGETSGNVQKLTAIWILFSCLWSRLGEPVTWDIGPVFSEI